MAGDIFILILNVQLYCTNVHARVRINNYPVPSIQNVWPSIIYRFLENLCSGASVRGDGCTGRHPRGGDCLRRGDFSSKLLPPRGEPGGGQGGYDRGPVESVAQRGQG